MFYSHILMQSERAEMHHTTSLEVVQALLIELKEAKREVVNINMFSSHILMQSGRAFYGEMHHTSHICHVFNAHSYNNQLSLQYEK